MTAQDANSVRSDNSDSRSLIEPVSVTRDPRTRRIVQKAEATAGTTTTREIASDAGWTLDETDRHVQRLEAENFVQLIGDRDRRIILLTTRGERLARGRL